MRESELVQQEQTDRFENDILTPRSYGIYPMRNFPKFIFSLNFLYLILIAAESVAIIFLCLYIPAFLPVAAAFVGIWLITLTAVIAVVCRGGSPEINLSLVLFLIALPAAGAVIYAFSLFCKKECGTLTITGANPARGYESVAYETCGICGAGYDKAVYFKNGEEFFPALFKEIERARERVYLEYFIVRKGEIFSRLLSALRTAKRNGAEIKIIIDGIGSAFKTRRKDYKKLKSLGAEIKIFHRLVPLVYPRLNNRDHRKIAAIDGKIAFTGGFNIADEYANIKSPLGYWKDTGVAIYGDAARIFEGMFLSVWNCGHKMKYKSNGKYRCLPFYDSPPQRAGFCENAYSAAIFSAKERVHIFTPYFCPSEKLASALEFAALRGADVRIVIPHIPDKKYAFELSKASAIPLIAKGIKFYEYTPGFMHAKSMVCDNRAFIGSYNFDFRSMRLNYECGVMFDGEICRQAESDFWECLRLSVPLREGKLSLPRRFYRFIIKLFAPLM